MKLINNCIWLASIGLAAFIGSLVQRTITPIRTVPVYLNNTQLKGVVEPEFVFWMVDTNLNRMILHIGWENGTGINCTLHPKTSIIDGRPLEKKETAFSFSNTNVTLTIYPTNGHPYMIVPFKQTNDLTVEWNEGNWAMFSSFTLGRRSDGVLVWRTNSVPIVIYTNMNGYIDTVNELNGRDE